MPACANASSSSPPRPNTNGSPPFSRTTRRPARACATSCSLIHAGSRRRRPGTCRRRFSPHRAAPDRARLGYQPVVQDHVRVAERAQRLQGQKLRIAGARTHQRDMSGRGRPGACPRRAAAERAARPRARRRRRSARRPVRRRASRNSGVARPSRGACAGSPPADRAATARARRCASGRTPRAARASDAQARARPPRSISR